jgi:DNA-binding FadR family transcriptional regulator
MSDIWESAVSSMIQPTRAEPLVVQVSRQFRERVASGDWPVHSRIPGEKHLAQELGVSRGTVREALRALTMSGLLEPRVGDGTYVRASDELTGLLRHGGGTELEHVLDVRSVLEVAAAERAARHRGDADLEAMRTAIALRAEAERAGDVDAYVSADSLFHRSVVDAAGNPLLTRLYDALRENVVESIRRTTSLPEEGGLNDLHEGLLAAIENGSPERARTIAVELADELGFISAVVDDPSDRAE